MATLWYCYREVLRNMFYGFTSALNKLIKKKKVPPYIYNIFFSLQILTCGKLGILKKIIQSITNIFSVILSYTAINNVLDTFFPEDYF